MAICSWAFIAFSIYHQHNIVTSKAFSLAAQLMLLQVEGTASVMNDSSGRAQTAILFVAVAER